MTTRDSRGVTLQTGDIVYSFTRQDNYRVGILSIVPGRVELLDVNGDRVGFAQASEVAYVGRDREPGDQS